MSHVVRHVSGGTRALFPLSRRIFYVHSTPSPRAITEDKFAKLPSRVSLTMDKTLSAIIFSSPTSPSSSPFPLPVAASLRPKCFARLLQEWVPGTTFSWRVKNDKSTRDVINSRREQIAYLSRARNLYISLGRGRAEVGCSKARLLAIPFTKYVNSRLVSRTATRTGLSRF